MKFLNMTKQKENLQHFFIIVFVQQSKNISTLHLILLPIRRKLKIIDSAIIHLQSLNITPNIEELSKITHLSSKTIKRSFEQRIYHQPTTLDKAYRINNYYENPETIFMHKQKNLLSFTKIRII